MLFSDSNDATTSSPKKPRVEVIDLTLSDSEDEAELPRPQSSHEISSGCVSPPVISIDSPAGPLSVSSLSSTDVSATCSNSSFSPHLSSSPSSSSSSNSTIGYNYPGPSGNRSPPLLSPTSSPRSHLSSRSPYKSPLRSPVSPVSSPISPLGTPTSPYMHAFPSLPGTMPHSIPSMFMSDRPGTSMPRPEDREIEDFLNGLYNEYR